jgi:5,10-methylene-tetrahydrofolate dehydrogenase/methenyl tetrahydrofolate cyclohydrolase
MTATILDGKALAQQLRKDVAADVAKRLEQGKARPGLATVLVGDNPASVSCEEVGIESFGHTLSADDSQADLEALLQELGADRRVSGILVQLPLPHDFQEEAALSLVPLEKDVDGFHPVNVGRLAQKGREPLFVPCTPAGVMWMLRTTGVKFEGARAVVLGRSNIVGMPTALLLVRENATVTICHSRTTDLPAVVREADILVAAIGRANFVRGDWIKPGAAVIDVGINRVEDSAAKRGYRLVGDVAYSEAAAVAGSITPVPGGVGPMTIAMLLKSTLKAAELQDT